MISKRNGTGDGTLTEEWGRLVQRVLNFAAFLRQNGLEVTTGETLDSIACLSLIDISSKERFYDTLRATFVKRSDDYILFGRLFEAFWKGQKEERPTDKSSEAARERSSSVRARVEFSRGAVRSSQDPGPSTTNPKGPETVVEIPNFALYSPIELLGRRHLQPGSGDPSVLKRLVKRFSRRLATRRGRRFEASRRGFVDLRRTLRSGIGSGGQMTELLRKRRKITKAHIVVLCDISGSMDSHSVRLLRLLYHLSNAARAEVFAFSTQLILLNDYLRGNSLYTASRLISENVTFWSSGTRIGSSLGRLLTQYPGYLTRSTVLVIISDGWELDDLGALKSNLRLIRRLVNEIIWLNPLADDPAYRPLAAGMSTALPFVTILAGLKTLESRHEFDRIFGKELNPIVSR